MSIITTAASAFFTYRFLRILTQRWEDMDAYKLGIIDENGNILKKTRQLRTAEEKSAYTIFHRLVFNLKKLLEKVPLGRTRIASYAAAMFLLREHTEMTEEQLQSVFDQLDIDLGDLELSESVYINEDQSLMPGTYYLKEDMMSPRTGELVALKGSKIQVNEFTQPAGSIFGCNVYKVNHLDTKESIYVTYENITR
jgi:hypothetical protein